LFDTAANQVLDDDINVGSSNTFTANGVLQVNTAHSITGNYTQGSLASLIIDANLSSYGDLVVSGSATMTNDNVTISGVLRATGETLTIVQASPAGTDYSGIIASATGFTALVSSITSGGFDDLVVSLSGNCQVVNSNTAIGSSIPCIVWNAANVTVTGNGTVAGAATAVANFSNVVGTLTNSGSINGGATGVYNTGTIAVISNSGLITGGSIGVYNAATSSSGTIISTGSIGTITNSGTISGSINGIYNNGGRVGTISNSGTISGGSSDGIYNAGTIGTISNTGLISGGGHNGIYNGIGSIGTISNTGLISGVYAGIETGGTIDNIANSGTISSAINTTSYAAIGIFAGAIGTITNSGLITGPNAIFSGPGSTILGAFSNSGTIIGNINVAQDLIFTGGNSSTIGTLTGYGTVTGTITANNLTFDSAAYQLLDDDVIVNSGTGTVTNSGTLMVKATHTIGGNYVQDSGALLVVGVIDPTHYGNLVITGNATMTNDHVSITPVSGTLNNGESFTIVQDTITGTADYSGITATATGFTVAVSSITAGGFDNLIVSLSGGGGGGGGGGTYGPIGSAAGGGVAPAVGVALDQIHAGGDPSFDPIFTALDNLGSISQASEQEGIKQLAPNPIMPQIAAAGLVMDQTVQVVGQHQEGLLAQAGDGSTVGKAAGSEYESGIFWAQASGGVATRDSSADSGGYRQSFYGLTFGMDDHIGKDTTLGEAIGWMHSNARGSGDLAGDTVSLNSIQFTGYGTRRFGPAFVDAMLGIGINLYSEKRDIGFLAEQAHAGYDGMQYMGRIEGGYDFPAGAFTLTPLAGFQAVRTATNAYSESGAGAADASVGGQGVNSFATTLGGKVATILPTAWGDIVPEIKAVWVHDLANGAIATPAQLGGVSFTTATPRAAQDGAQVTLAATLKEGNSVAVRAEYDGDIRSDYTSHSGLVKVEWNF
jgi:uncharacterized protein with beta-barrel porin domain